MRNRKAGGGQATVEWTALVLLAALLLGTLAWAAGVRPPGTALAQTIAERLVCAVRLSEDCESEPRLTAAYGVELAALLRTHAPTLLYEEGMTALPVDYRRCREDRCAAGAGEGTVSRSWAGEPIVAFTHVIDCRRQRVGTEAGGADCSGERAGNLYLQYWFYYPGSATAEGSTFLKGPIRTVSRALGKPTHHRHDWESYQVRIGPAGRFARASSHHGYSYELGGEGLIPGHRLRLSKDGRIALRRLPRAVNGWGPEVGTLYVSGGSHAGNARVFRSVSRLTKDHRLRLVPLKRIALADATDFGTVTRPWLKGVYRDPEYGGTG